MLSVKKIRNAFGQFLVKRAPRDTTLETLRNVSRMGEHLVAEDISNGREINKIPALSYKRHDKPPDDYKYINERMHDKDVCVDTSVVGMAYCLCSGDCSDGGCHSSQVRSGHCYDAKGCLSAAYDVDAPEAILECNVACRCNPKVCTNRVIQRGSTCKLVLFRTRSRGWGVRSAEPLKRGTFIGTYCGQLITASESLKRADDTYLFNLANTITVPPAPAPSVTVRTLDSASHYSEDDDEQQQQPAQPAEPTAEDTYVCDAKFFGNVTRFVNHSCEPNVIGIRSFTTHADQRFPHIAFFTNKDVSAHTELTLNYGDNYWLVKCKRDSVYCLCERPSCKFSKHTFAKTYKEHKRLQDEQRQLQEQQQQQQAEI